MVNEWASMIIFNVIGAQCRRMQSSHRQRERLNNENSIKDSWQRPSVFIRVVPTCATQRLTVHITTARTVDIRQRQIDMIASPQRQLTGTTTITVDATLSLDRQQNNISTIRNRTRALICSSLSATKEGST